MGKQLEAYACVGVVSNEGLSCIFTVLSVGSFIFMAFLLDKVLVPFLFW